MSSGADLFVVCKQCGSEVSPYITECPYCGNRLRRRAPKLPREGEGRPGRRPGGAPSLGRLRRGEIPGIRAESHPYTTIALVAASCVAWVLVKGGYLSSPWPHLLAIDQIASFLKIAILGSPHGQWWRLLTFQFAYRSGLCAFAVMLAVAIFGWLLERRHGPLVVAALFFGGGVAAALVALAVHPDGLVSGANAGALGLLAAWVIPDLQRLRRGESYEGDLLGSAAIAALLLAMPLARTEVSWIAGVVGLLIGAAAGFGLAATEPSDS
jgi:membrane associated rhomboid family serine protease